MKKQCIGFGGVSLRCTNEVGKNPYWCDNCDKLRMASISQQMAEIAKGLKQ